MDPLAVYAVETRAIVHVLWGGVIALGITALSFVIMYVLLRISVRDMRGRLKAAEVRIATLTRENETLRKEHEGIEDLKKEARRHYGIRQRCEDRLKSQNAELETLRDLATIFRRTVGDR